MKDKNPVNIKDAETNKFIKLCEEIKPKQLIEKDIDKFSANLDNSFNVVIGNDDYYNDVNANVLASIPMTDELFKSSISVNGASNSIITREMLYHMIIQYKKYLTGIFDNLLDQSIHVLINKISDYNHIEFTLHLDDYLKYNKNEYKNFSIDIVSKLLYLYCNSYNDKQFAVAAIQVATLCSNNITLQIRNDIFKYISMSIPNKPLEDINIIISKSWDIFGGFHDSIVNIIQYMSELIVNYFHNYKQYSNFDENKYDVIDYGYF